SGASARQECGFILRNSGVCLEDAEWGSGWLRIPPQPLPCLPTEDISVVFSTVSWEGRADFSQADVHRQIAIVFKTPPYEDLEISEPVTVNVFLQRLTDGVCSEPLPFTYLPRDHDSYGVDKKRKRGMPDVLGELSSSDPHGIESKRRKKKPAFLDHFLPGHSS
ncbi:PREDICTED: transcription factor RelB-like, partial [Dipodomys ordii]|uniref:Transcription factor RelB-like n=1 Tax=Dipodomys ordii TaxID=10020 RepID=A0A1S3GWX8_DIPOR